MATTAKLDTVYRVETPEGISLTFHPASAVVRALAFAIDLLCQGLIILSTTSLILWLYMLIIARSEGFDSFYIGFVTLVSFIVNWWYFVLFEVLRNGQSPGKKAFNLRVIHDDGTPIGWSASLLRNLLRVVDLLPTFTYTAGLICSLNNRAFKRLGDIAAGTLVVYQTTKPVTNASTLPNVVICPSPFPLSLAEQGALISFALRSNNFSPERRQELASILNPAFKTASAETERTLMGIAGHLVGSGNPSEQKRDL